jgi:hypothetical protein
MAAIDIQRAGATAILTMNRPEQRNALDYPMREAFAAANASERFIVGSTNSSSSKNRLSPLSMAWHSARVYRWRCAPTLC